MAQVPEHLLRRSATARAKASGLPFEVVFAKMKGEAPPPGAAMAAPMAAAPGAVQMMPVAASGPARDLDAESAKHGVPRRILERAMLARARKDGTGVPVMAGAVAAAPMGVPAAVPTGGMPVLGGPPPGVRTQRLLTVVKANAIQGTTREPVDRVNVWPHLLAIEFVALLVMLALLTLMSVFIDAPLLEFANFNEQPNPSKAPWYFLGLQELLAYFDPQVAGVLLPTFGMIALMFIPYVDRNPSVRPSDRKLAIAIFTVFFMSSSILTIFGSFFRGPGFNFVFPWREGIFFDDLKTLLE